MRLSVRNLCISTSTKALVTDVSFELDECASLGIIGPSGSGKTSLLRGILDIADGLMVQGEVLFSPAEHTDKKKLCGYIPQDLALWPHLTVHETVQLAYRFSQKREEKAQTNLVTTLIEQCGLKNLSSQKPAALSGGEKQRLALARALVGTPSLLVLDEPFSGLDVVAKSDIIALVHDLQKSMGFSIIFVSHDLAETLALGRFIMVMNRGLAIWFGKARALSSSCFLPTWNPLQSPLVNQQIPLG